MTLLSEYLRRERDRIEKEGRSIFDTDKLRALRPHALQYLNVMIAKACYAERVLAQGGVWYADMPRKSIHEWSIAGGV